MRLRLGPGPVFAYEWLICTRRWQMSALRGGFVGAILVGMTFIWHNEARYDRSRQHVSIQQAARYAQLLYGAVVLVELTLVLLAAPAAAVGAICIFNLNPGRL